MRKGENIYKRKDGRWEGRYIKDRTNDKKIIYGYIYGKKYSEVKERLTDIREKTAETVNTDKAESQEYVGWLEKSFFPELEKRIKGSTYSAYYRFISQHISPFFEGKKFSEMTEELCQEFITTLYEKGLRVSSIRVIFSLLKQSILEAVRQEYLAVNPVKQVHFPKENKKKIQALSLCQQYKLEELALETPDGLPVIVSLYSGLRIGEICGLNWDDIDFDTQTICVNKTVSRITNKRPSNKKTKVIVDTPKTEFSHRQVPMSAKLSDYLHRMKESSHDSYLVSTPFGRAEPRIVSHRFKKLIASTDFSTIHFHVLRHTFATRCLEQGMDIATLSKIMGHQSTKLTLDTYSDSLMDQRIKEIKKLDHLYK